MKLGTQMKAKLRRAFARERDVLFCYVFGSFARGDALKKSDIDIALYLAPRKGVDFFAKRLRLMEKVSRALSKDTDVVILNTAPPLLRYAAVQEGLVVFETDRGSRIDFELKTMNEYSDYLPYLKQYNARLLANIS